MSQRAWTPGKATRSLPLVKRIAEDILLHGRELRRLSEKKRISAAERARAEELMGRLKGYMAELERLGCQFKDFGFERALVDFPGEIDGKPVLLCWQTGEETVEFYHGEEEGFAGRKRIPGELLRE